MTVRHAIARTGAATEPGHRERLHPAAVALVILVLAAISFFRFPGHTILQSDTQIYIPILEHIWDPTALTRDIMATRPHVSFTLYDETALALRAVTGAKFETVLMAQQFVYRIVGIAGLYFLAAAIGLSTWKTLFVAAVMSLGATIAGPAVLTVEYEPVPRGFALPFLLASMAAVAHERWRLAAAAGTIAFSFHPPTAVAYYAILFVLLVLNRRVSDIGVLAAGPALMLVTALLSTGVTERQHLFGRIDSQLEQLQRLRGSYNFVSIWLGNWWQHYLVLWIAGLVALWRLRSRFTKRLMLIMAGLPFIGVLALPVSYVLLERAKWVLLPQFQPGRYLLFVTFTAALACAIAGVVAAERRRWLEAIVMLTIAFAIPTDAKVTNILAPDFGSALAMKRLGLTVGLAIAATISAAWNRGLALTAVGLLAFFIIPTVGQVRNYPALHHAELDELARWARENTPKDALFQFADAGRDLPPGVFRARAGRALYVDWKAGGQVNFHKQFSDEWWRRWQKLEKPLSLDAYRTLGIDYVVFKAGNGPAGVAPVYSNAKYVVYNLR